MKAKISKEELRECVSKAVNRIINEKNNMYMGNKNRSKNPSFDGPSKHEKAKQSHFNEKKQKGGGNRQRWTYGDDDED